VDGLVTLFYDGSKELYNYDLDLERLIAYGRRLNQGLGSERADDLEAMDVSDVCKKYIKERLSWQQIIILQGVTEIPKCTFSRCYNIRRVIFADTVIRIQRCAFYRCKSLVYVKWSLSLEFIGECSFQLCNLSNVFIPRSCREIGDLVFEDNPNLSILHVQQDTQLGSLLINSINGTNGSYNFTENDYMNQWLKNINNGNQFALHRACASFNALKEVIHAIILRKGLKAFRQENSAGIESRLLDTYKRIRTLI